MNENEKIIEVAKAAIENSTSIITTCRQIIKNCSPQQQIKPRLIGLRTASRLVGISQTFLRHELELGELTGWQTKKGGRWRVDPEKLVEEIKNSLAPPKSPIKRRKRSPIR